MARKNQRPAKLFENLLITDIASEGKCVARAGEIVIFVEGVVPGDVVDVSAVKRKSFYEGKAVKFHQYSTDRATPFCSHFGTCGGCKWQNLAYSQQLAFKERQVVNALQRIGKVQFPEARPILGSANIQFYRNKLEYTATARRWLTQAEIDSGDTHTQRSGLGFHIPGKFDKVLDIEACYLQPDPSNAIRLAIKHFAVANNWEFFSHQEKSGFLRNVMLRTALTGEVMVVVQFFRPDMPAIEALMQHLQAQFPQIASLNYVVNTKLNDTIYDQDIVCYAGKPYITETMEGLQYRVGPKSFYQTNAHQAYELYKITRDFAQLTGNEVVYDLYTGTGTIALFVAKLAKQVIGLEYVEAAIEDAKVNAQINNIDHAQFYAGDIRHLLSAEFLANHPRPDVIITDPPRAGMHEDVVKMLLEIAAPRIVYVSCNPATQARDLQLLDSLYEIKAVQPVDMFPHTEHVENVVLLEKRPV